MKITKKLIETMVREQIQEAQNLASKAVPIAHATLNLPAAKAVFDKLKDIINSQGEPGQTGRKEEGALILGALGINVNDLTMIISAMRSEQSGAEEAEPTEQ